MGDCQVNDDCTGALAVSSLPFYDISTTESSTGEGYERNAPAFSCKGLLPELKANWYQLIANNSSCLIAKAVATSSTGIFVYEGESCDVLRCIDEEAFGSGTVQWTAEEGKSYFILVGSDGFSSSSDYLLTISVRIIEEPDCVLFCYLY
jgi:hypothetical protein